jgi:hypothetical protein
MLLHTKSPLQKETSKNYTQVDSLTQMFNFGRCGHEGFHDLRKSSYAKYKYHKSKEYYKITYNESDKLIMESPH